MREPARKVLFMAPHKTVTINGRAYDAVTGLPIESVEITNPDKTPIKKPVAAPAKKPAPKTSRGLSNSEIVHSTTQRSQTLARRVAKKPAAPNRPVTKRSAPGKHMDIAKSASVSRFAAHPVTQPETTPKAVAARPAAPKPIAQPKRLAKKPVTKPAVKPDQPAKTHPLAQRALARATAKKAAVAPKPTTAKEVKDAQISKALAAPKPKAKKQSKKDRKALRRVIIIGSIVLVVVIALFAAWRLVPAISVGVAAAQAGIDASYPEYTPDGYSLSQPVTFSDGEVDLKFTSNSNGNYYTITQSRSSWDSSAVLDNVVTPVAGQDYTTTKERGLTIYSFDNSATWVNGGILYKIDSKAPLSGDQIRKIATSL